ncbi:MAG: Clp protease N-terminal domain-containing protein [Chloroflexota bacterium]
MITNSRYSQHARRAISYARSLAKAYAYDYIDSTHLFIGILHEEGAIGCNILQDLQMDLRRTERTFYQLHKPNEKGKGTAPILVTTEALQAALQLADDESRWLGQHYVGTEHLLLGLARSNEESLLNLLRALAISPEQIRRKVRRLLQDGITEVSIEQAKRVARLSELSRRVLNAAEQVAERMGHKDVGLAHLLLVLAHERRSICARLLREAGFDDVALEANLTKPRPATGGMLENVIDRAVDRAESFGSHYTGTDHLLLTLATDPRGVALLRKYGADPKQIVQQLRDYLSK